MKKSNYFHEQHGTRTRNYNPLICLITILKVYNSLPLALGEPRATIAPIALQFWQCDLKYDIIPFQVYPSLASAHAKPSNKKSTSTINDKDLWDQMSSEMIAADDPNVSDPIINDVSCSF